MSYKKSEKNLLKRLVDSGDFRIFTYIKQQKVKGFPKFHKNYEYFNN